MTRHAQSGRRALALLAVVLACALAAASAQSPSKKPLTVDDYTRWRSVTGQEISGDGRWVTYVLQLTNVPTAATRPILHLLNLDTDQDVAVPDATGGVFSPDSQWIAYDVDPGRERRGRSGRGGTPAPGESPEPAVTPGGQPAPAAGAQAGRGAAAGPIPPSRVELRNLATGAVQSWQDVQAFLFSPSSTHLILKRRPASTGGGGRGGSAAASGGAAPGAAPSANASGAPVPAQTGPRGTDVVLVDLRTGRHQLLGSVGEIAFNKKGDLLAYTVDAAVKDGNGVFVFEARRGRHTPLDNGARTFSRLAWSDDGTSLAVLKGTDVEKMRERENVLLAFRDLPSAIGDEDIPLEPVILDPGKAAGFPKGSLISDRAALSWSDDNTRVFFGVKEQVAAPDAVPRKTTDEASNVDVWNTADERIQSVQMIRAEQDRNFTFRQAFDVSAARFVKLADETMRDLDVAQDGRWAVGRDTRGYIHDHKRPAADIYRVNTATGERTLMLKNQIINTSTGSHTFGISPDGRYFLYWKDNKYQAYDLHAGTARTLGAVPAAAADNATSKKTMPVSFVDMEFDHPGPRPSYGIAGYTSDGTSVIVQQRYDLWALPLDGAAPRNLTNGAGAANEIRFRYVRLDPPDPPTTLPAAPSQPGGAPGGPPPGFAQGGRGSGQREKPIDLTKPLILSAYGEWTKKAGFYELANGQIRPLVYEEAAFSTPARAAHAEKVLFTRQTFVEFPDLRVAGAGFTGMKKITDANPQQAEFLWGHRVLFDFKDKDGHRLQAVLTIPDDYKAGEKRPMLVSFYEKNSQNLYRYNAPSYLTGMGASPIQAVSNGYVTLLPDVQFHTGASHSDMLEAVEAATRKAIDLGYADPRRIGINGHSYGGEGAAFIGTRSRLFAAVGVGAGVTDLYYDFNQNWGWSYQVTGGSGANGSDYYLYSQGREGVSPWDKPDMYMFESALTHVPEATAPFLIMHGTADPTVSFTNGLAFYNALRYNNKKAVLLAYPGEGHGLRGMANRKDLTIRYFEFFDHYLKGTPAPKWITEGVPFLVKETMRQ